MRHDFLLIFTRKERDFSYFFMTLSAIFRVYKMLRSTFNSEINSLFDKYSLIFIYTM